MFDSCWRNSVCAKPSIQQRRALARPLCARTRFNGRDRIRCRTISRTQPTQHHHHVAALYLLHFASDDWLNARASSIYTLHAAVWPGERKRFSECVCVCAPHYNILAHKHVQHTNACVCFTCVHATFIRTRWLLQWARRLAFCAVCKSMARAPNDRCDWAAHIPHAHSAHSHRGRPR